MSAGSVAQIGGFGADMIGLHARPYAVRSHQPDQGAQTSRREPERRHG
ncbi:hypothetical protein [Microvirga arabica]|nr:hypothetical protein [Microvirga arabica]MBM1172031.1 hypothetical protein [Microvirga arabica]